MKFGTLKKFTKNDVLNLFPKLHEGLHKGQCGNIAVIGGSLEYTGAPYFSAITSMKVGGDLAHVFCQQSASTPIKCYCPDLIVHPLLDDVSALDQIKKWLPRLHSVVVGPGLGRDPHMMSLCLNILDVLKQMNKITIIDADGLFAVLSQPAILKDFKNLILTPNAVEFQRLYSAVSGQKDFPDVREACKYLSEQLQGVTIIQKGFNDYIFNGDNNCVVDNATTLKRCGGQGDILSGAVAIFAHWASLQSSDYISNNLLAAYAGCYCTRVAARYVWDIKKRSMITNDVIEKMDVALNLHFV